MPFLTYSESVTTSTAQASVSARKPSMAARSSMRLLVVCGSDPHISFVRCLWSRMHAQPPAPGLPRQEPSVMICTFFTGSGSHRRCGLEEFVHQIENRLRLLRLVDGCAKLRAVAHAVGEVSGELLHLADRVLLAALHQHRIIAAHHLITIMLARLIVEAGGHVLLDLAEDPRIGACRAAHHHGVAAGFSHHADGVLVGDTSKQS